MKEIKSEIDSIIVNLKKYHKEYSDAEKRWDDVRRPGEYRILSIIENEWSEKFPGTKITADFWDDDFVPSIGNLDAGAHGISWEPEIFLDYEFVKKDVQLYRPTTDGWEYCPSEDYQNFIYSQMIPETNIEVYHFIEFFDQIHNSIDCISGVPEIREPTGEYNERMQKIIENNQEEDF